jgi:hypothetical protein
VRVLLASILGGFLKGLYLLFDRAIVNDLKLWLSLSSIATLRTS